MRPALGSRLLGEPLVTLPAIAAPLVILACLDAQITAADAKLAQLLPDTPYAPLTTVPGWGTVRAANYGAAVGDVAARRYGQRLQA